MKVAYPNTTYIEYPFKRADLKKWKDMRLKIRAAQRTYITYTKDQIIEAYIKEWSNEEQRMFKEWLRRFDQDNKKYAGNKTMEKVSYEFVSDKLRTLEDLKRKLRSRVQSIESLINKMIDNNLLGNGSEAQEKVIFLSRILQRLREEINTLRSPVLLEACQKRALQMFKKAGIDEGVDILRDTIELTASFSGRSFIKTAQHVESNSGTNQLQEALDIIGSEINFLSYKTHLKRMYKALNALENAGRSSDVDVVARVIRDDLPDLEKMNKRLMEVYTNLSQQKAEMEIGQKLRG